MEENNKIYDSAFKNKAVRLSYKSNCIEKLEKELDLYFSSLSKWQKDYHKIANEDSFSSEKERIYFLEKKINIIDLKFEILKDGKFYISQEKPMLFDFLKNNEKNYSIRQMCTVLKVNRGTYHRWKNQFVSEKEERKILVKEEITSIFFEVKQRYGYNRITIELQNRGYKVSRSTVLAYMRELGLHSNITKKDYK